MESVHLRDMKNSPEIISFTPQKANFYFPTKPFSSSNSYPFTMQQANFEAGNHEISYAKTCFFMFSVSILSKITDIFHLSFWQPKKLFRLQTDSGVAYIHKVTLVMKPRFAVER